MKIVDWVKNNVYNLDCRIGLDNLPDECIDTFISSPPYYSVRDYDIDPIIWDEDPNCEHEWIDSVDHKYSGGISDSYGLGQFSSDKTHFVSTSKTCIKCGAWLGDLGLEPSPDLFIKHLCDIYDKIKRVLKPTGTVWINLGDTYSGGKSQRTGKDTNFESETFGGWKNWDCIRKTVKTTHEIPRKCMMMIPERFAIEMIDRGWILRSKVIWHKPNAMPDSAKDRFPVDYEIIYFFVKSDKYFFDREAIREEISQSEASLNRRKYKPGKNEGRYSEAKEFSMSTAKDQYWSDGRYKRSVWSINTKQSPAEHYAAYPEDLVEPMILAGCPERICKICEKPLYPIYEDKNHSKIFIGYEKCCGNEDDWKPGIVCDPFSGIGTTMRTAISLERDYIGFELSKQYTNYAVQFNKERVEKICAEKHKGQGDFLML